jgi:hypothetical protein
MEGTNGLHNLKIDLDRLDYYSHHNNVDKVEEYKDLIVNHLRELVYNTDPYSKELQVKEILSKEIFEKMPDQGAAQVLRSILLADRNNVIDWSQAFYYVQKYMPELKMFD